MLLDYVNILLPRRSVLELLNLFRRRLLQLDPIACHAPSGPLRTNRRKRWALTHAPQSPANPRRLRLREFGPRRSRRRTSTSPSPQPSAVGPCASRSQSRSSLSYPSYSSPRPFR